MHLIGVAMDREKIQNHIKHLQEKHDNLDQLIQEEFNRYQDDKAVANLKKEKLLLKDEIATLTKQLNTV
jgi:hypothetical protein